MAVDDGQQIKNPFDNPDTEAGFWRPDAETKAAIKRGDAAYYWMLAPRQLERTKRRFHRALTKLAK